MTNVSNDRPAWVTCGRSFQSMASQAPTRQFEYHFKFGPRKSRPKVLLTAVTGSLHSRRLLLMFEFTTHESLLYWSFGSVLHHQKNAKKYSIGYLLQCPISTPAPAPIPPARTHGRSFRCPYGRYHNLDRPQTHQIRSI